MDVFTCMTESHIRRWGEGGGGGGVEGGGGGVVSFSRNGHWFKEDHIHII